MMDDFCFMNYVFKRVSVDVSVFWGHLLGCMSYLSSGLGLFIWESASFLNPEKHDLDRSTISRNK